MGGGSIFYKGDFLNPTKASPVPPLTGAYAAYAQSNSPPTVIPHHRSSFSPAPLYQRQALPRTFENGSFSKQKQDFNRVIQCGTNLDYNSMNQALSVSSFDDPIDYDCSDNEKPKSLEKTSSLSSMDDSLTTLSHLSDLNISDESQPTFMLSANNTLDAAAAVGNEGGSSCVSRPISLG